MNGTHTVTRGRFGSNNKAQLPTQSGGGIVIHSLGSGRPQLLDPHHVWISRGDLRDQPVGTLRDQSSESIDPEMIGLIGESRHVQDFPL